MINLENFTIREDKLCQSCLSMGMIIFHKLRSVPANSCIMLSTRREALEYPKGDILLGFCPQCGFISNVAFDPKLTVYSERYEETQGFSPTFRKFHQELAGELIERYDLHGKTIIEIGCGKGEFLSLLCELGGNRGIGFDPAYIDERNKSEAADRIIFIKDYYSEKYSHYKGDFIVCKMTLEHIANPYDFVTMIRRSIANNLGAIIFIQVPDVTRILNKTCFEDIYYEHCSYFTPESMASLFNKCGFGILRLSSTFDDQYFTLEAQPLSANLAIASRQINIDHLKQYLKTFQIDYQNKYASWQIKLAEIRAKKKRVVLWGSGSKAVSFLTTLKVSNEIQFVVDINPYRRGFYVAGTGQKIVSPNFLQVCRPDSVIIMNPIYQREIQEEIKTMGLTVEFETI
jgi:SAM-dependent methyltransferase